MKELLGCELKNIFKKKKTTIFLIIEFVFILFMYLIIKKYSWYDGMPDFNLFSYLINESFANILIIGFTMFFTVEIAMPDNFKKVKEIGLTKIITSKLIVIAIMVIIQYIVILIPSLIIALSQQGSANISIGFYGLLNQSLLGIIISISFSFMIEIVTESKVAAVTIPMIFYMIGNTLSYSTFHGIRNYFIYSYVGNGIDVCRLNTPLTYILAMTIIYIIVLWGISIGNIYF